MFPVLFIPSFPPLFPCHCSGCCFIFCVIICVIIPLVFPFPVRQLVTMVKYCVWLLSSYWIPSVLEDPEVSLTRWISDLITLNTSRFACITQCKQDDIWKVWWASNLYPHRHVWFMNSELRVSLGHGLINTGRWAHVTLWQILLTSHTNSSNSLQHTSQQIQFQ